jgi:hypothetical protein
MRIFAISVTALMIAASAASAADNAAPLSAGNPAGVHNAQMGNDTLLVAVGAGAFIAAVAVLASGSGNNNITNATTPTTTTTATTTTG